MRAKSLVITRSVTLEPLFAFTRRNGSMETSKISGWITVAAILAGLEGLIFVAIQIRQSTRSIRAAAYQTWVASATQWNMGIASDTELAKAIVQGHTDAGKLTEVSQLQYSMSMLALMQMIQSTYYLYID